MNRISDFEAQVSSQLQAYTSDVDKKLSFLNSRRTTDEPDSIQGLSRDLDAVKYDVGELKDLLNGAKGDTAQVKRIVLACERDMEDFTAAMDAVNVDLDEMRARVDSTHSIITSRQRVEATVTAEISTMRLDMGDMQEALKAHDAWMEDVSQSLQEVHERCEYLNMEISGVNQNFQAKLDAKTDIASWNDMSGTWHHLCAWRWIAAGAVWMRIYFVCAPKSPVWTRRSTAKPWTFCVKAVKTITP